jgi:ankyrin repeat protein
VCEPPPQVRFLVKSGGTDLNAVDAFGNTALHVAVERGHISVVAALLEEGADIGLFNVQVTECFISLLMLHCGTLSRHRRMLQGRAPLHYAVYMGNQSIASELLRR